MKWRQKCLFAPRKKTIFKIWFTDTIELIMSEFLGCCLFIGFWVCWTRKSQQKKFKKILRGVKRQWKYVFSRQKIVFFKFPPFLFLHSDFDGDGVFNTLEYGEHACTKNKNLKKYEGGVKWRRKDETKVITKGADGRFHQDVKKEEHYYLVVFWTWWSVSLSPGHRL